MNRWIAGLALLWFYGAAPDGADADDAVFPVEDAVRSALRQELIDVGGQPRTLGALAGETGTAIVFLSTECPISNGYVPGLNRLHQRFGAQGISLIGVNSNAGQSPAEVAEHVRKFDIRFPVLKDEPAVVADGLGIETCPMVLVLDADQRPVYQGRIDDRYGRRGGGARDLRRADLELALTELLAGKSISVPFTEPIGCPLLRKAEAAATTAIEPSATYSGHIARILQKHCQECHRPHGVAPFSLLTYDDAVSWAKDIEALTANRTMPPWLPRSGHDNLVNARLLSDEELAQIADWVKSGTPEGDPKHLPERRQFRDGWQLGEPDVVLKPTESYTLSAEGEDEYRCFVIPTDFDSDLYVKAMEVLPGTRAVVHHVLVFLDSGLRAAHLDAKDPLPGFATSAGFPGFIPSGALGGWAPGNTPDFLPDGIARVLPKGTNVVMQVHYHKTGKVERDQTQLGLYLAKEPINRLTRGLPIAPMNSYPPRMTIPAGESNFEMTVTRELHHAVLLLGITPHMHWLGQDMTVTAALPDGSERTLLDTRWNFNWQESYQFREPISLPQGTQVTLIAHFDNSDGNPNNPNRPPKTVHWGERTSDEMCIAFLEVTSPTPVGSPDELKPFNPREEFREAFLKQLRENPGQLWQRILSRFRSLSN